MIRRRFFHPTRSLIGLVVSLVGAGCTGGQTGGEEPEAPGSTSGCEAQRAPVAIDAVTPLGLSAEQLLAPLLATHRSALLWRENTEPVTLAPEQGQSSIEVALSYPGGNVAWVHFEEPPRRDAGTGATMGGATTGVGTAPATIPPPPGAAPAPTAPPGEPVTTFPDAGVPNVPVCSPDRLEVDVSVLLPTGGGALDEAFTATLQISARDAAQLDHELMVDQLTGALAVSAPPGVTAATLRLSAAWDTAGFHGTLAGGITFQSGTGDRGVVGFGRVEYAIWPPPADGASP